MRTEDILSANKQLNEWCDTQDINYHEGITALGYLFKYAVPKTVATIAFSLPRTQGIPEAYRILFGEWIRKYTEQTGGLELVDALFWVIWEAIHGS